LKLVEKIKAHYGEKIRGLKLALWGLSFKPKTDDMRESPAIEIIRGIIGLGGKICAYDPVAMAQARKIFKAEIEYGKNPYQSMEGAQGLVIVTEWNEFRRPNFQKMRELLKEPVIFDGRNIYDPIQMKELGFIYYSIGR